MIASIRTDECIGCTKCLAACPYDAIIGSAKLLHTVLKAECTGCGLCVAPCPVDCIDMLSEENLFYDPIRAHQRLEARNRRLQRTQRKNTPLSTSTDLKNDIKAAVLRTKNRRNI